MIFRQRIATFDPVGYTWAHIQSDLLSAASLPASLWSACTSRLSSWQMANSQAFTALMIGIVIGSSASAFLTGDLVFMLCYALPFWLVAMLALPLRQGTQVQQREILPVPQASEPFEQQQGQQIGIENLPCIMTSIPEPIPNAEEMTLLVEDALRHLYDFSYLGQHQLVQLQLLERQRRLLGGAPNLNTHLDRGRALHALLIEFIEKLRPVAGLASGTVPQREWRAYMILYASYVQGAQTCEIMARLYIGEGTYSRTRRRALSSIARAIQEVESQIRS